MSKGIFLKPENGSKIIVTKEKEKRKRKSEEKERRRREKVIVSLLVFIIATLEFLAEKNCSTQKVHLAIIVSKIRLDIQPSAYVCFIVH